MYLRTNCDRELFFSLFKSNASKDIVAAGMPAPLSARPNIELVTAAGVVFETQEMDMLLAEFGASNVAFVKKKAEYQDTDLSAALAGGVLPLVCLQPALDPTPFRTALLTADFGLTAAEEAIVPPLSGLRPDVVVVRPRGSLQWEVLPSGKRRLLHPTDDRKALSVIDIKNTLEGNKSYAAEVVLYSLFLAKWLQSSPYAATHFVSDECFLWTHNEKKAFNALPPGTGLQDKLDVLLGTLEKIEFAVIAPSVVKFFKEDIPRVLQLSASGGWGALDYHPGPKCSNCDWLGFERWLSTDDKKLLAANPTWYCTPSASATQHLSCIPNLSRGARQVLEAHGVANLPALKALPVSAAALTMHSLLKRDRSHLAFKADAIISNTSSTDTAAALSGLARDVEFEVAISVNFDSAAGLLTGIACRGTVFMPFGSTPSVRQVANFAAPVENQDSKSEWDVLLAFLSALDQAVQSAATLLGKPPKAQIYFWERRQFEELCGAVGRHLARILSPAVKFPKGSIIQALTWVFPPEDLVERDAAFSPHIVFVGDIAERVVRIPTPHAFTLLAVHEAYHLPTLPPRYVDIYFRDPLGNGIPRERIFEVWKNGGTIKRGGVVVTKAQAAADYLNALRNQSYALASVSSRLRQDFKKNLKGSAKQFKPSKLTGAQKVAFDAKLWAQWSFVEAATSHAERMVEFTLPADALEASYKALVLEHVISIHSPARRVFAVRAESREAKLDDDGEYFALGSSADPGLPLETPASLGLPFDPKYLKNSGSKVTNTHHLPLFSCVRVKIHSLDRDALQADVEILPRRSSCKDVVDDLISGGYLPNGGNLFLMDSAPYDDSEKTEAILKAIGAPSFAAADPSSLRAMGVNAPPATGTDPSSPAAQVLWNAGSLAATPVRTPAQAAALAARAKVLVKGFLDPSQEKAIAGLSERQLSLVWGPPGTGKTSTLTAYLLAVVEEALAASRPMKILLTGPNYRAVEVLTHKLLQAVNGQPALKCHLFNVCSRTRDPVPLPEPAQPHVVAGSVSLGNPSAETMLQASYGAGVVSFYTTSAHTVQALVEALTGNPAWLVPAFDLVVIDESSQVPVNLALRPLAALKDKGELVVAGDYKQMPPVQVLPPPVGAEHLVGSIHTYLMKRFKLTQQPLNVNYRSADHLVEFARTLGYDPALKANTPDRRLQLHTAPSTVTLPSGFPPSAMWQALLDPAKVVSCVIHDDPSSAQANPHEAQMVATLAYLLRNCASTELAPGGALAPFTDEEFIKVGLGVVTPHKAQRALVISELKKLFPTVSRELIQESVDTVERFQGGERHTIIVSFGVGDVDVIQGEEQFLLQMERANVAISRAMAKCIVMMPKTLAYHLPNDSKVAQTAGALKSYVEEFCAQRAEYPLGAGKVEVRWR
jgi:hypothetical protein